MCKSVPVRVVPIECRVMSLRVMFVRVVSIRMVFVRVVSVRGVFVRVCV